MEKQSKEKEHNKRLDLAKELIHSGRPNNMVLSEMMIRNTGLSQVVAKKIIKEARFSISQSFTDERITSLSIELMHTQQVFFDVKEKLNQDNTFIDKFGNEQEKDISNLYKIVLATIAEKVKLINMIEDLKETKVKKSESTTVVRYEILGSKSPLMAETMDLFDKEKNE